MTTIPTTATVPLQPPAPGATTAAAAPTTTPQLGTMVLPATTPSMDAIIGALTKLIADLAAIVQAMKGANALGGGPTKGGGPDAKGGGPVVQTPVQSPLQVPTQTPIQGGGKAAGGGAVTGGGAVATSATPVTTLQPVSSDYRGPTMSASQVSLSMNSGSDAYTAIGGTAQLQLFGRYGSSNVGYGDNEASISGPGVAIGTRIAMPDAGSIQLSTGATFSWSPSLSQNNLGMVSNAPQYSTTRPGQAAPLSFSATSVDTVPGHAEYVANPLTAAELAELVKAIASRYPAVAR